MPQFTDTFKQQLSDQTSIVELVGRYVRLTRKGAEHWGCCPFHNEKTPSFKVNEVRKAYKCFGCGEGGDAISFLMKLEGLGFVEAVKELAEKAGIPLPEEDLSPEEQERARRRDALYHANEVACRYFERTLAGPEGEKGQQELRKREVDPELARKYRIGLTLDAWDGLVQALQADGISAQAAAAAGLILERKGGDGWYDRFRDRLMFPICTSGGKVVAFGGRTLGDATAKYINSPESPVYSKSGALYGLHQARASIHKEDRVLVVEGYFDVLGLTRAGLGFAVAPCGTALTERQLSTLRRHTRNVTVLFDADEAGQRAADRALELSLAQGLWPSWLSVPDGKDPDDFVREHGGEAMRELLTQRRPLLDVYLEHRFEAAAGDRFAQEAILDDVAPMVRDLPPTQRRDYAFRIAGDLGVNPRVIEDRIRSAGRARRQRTTPEPPPMPEWDGAAMEAPAPSRPVVRSTPTERQLLRLLIQDLGEVAPAMDDMGAMSWLRSPSVELVAGRLLRAWRDKRQPSAMELLADVDEPEVISEVSEVLTSESAWLSEKVLQKATQDCLIRLRIGWVERRRAKASRELSALQHQGSADLGLMQQLAGECLDLKRELDTWNDHLQKVMRG